MLKRLGITAFILMGASLFLGPTAALAQRGYYSDGGYGYQRDYNHDRRDERRWRERERQRYRAMRKAARDVLAHGPEKQVANYACGSMRSQHTLHSVRKTTNDSREP